MPIKTVPKEIIKMEFYYAEEKRKFDKSWEETAKYYAEQGMEQSAIDAMREFDWDTFKQQRRWALHTQELPTTNDEDEESGIAESPMVGRFFEDFTTTYDKYGAHSRRWWLEEISDPRIVAVLPHLTDEDKELLTLIYVDGYTQQECAVKMHITQRGIGYKLQRVFGKIAEK